MTATTRTRGAAAVATGVPARIGRDPFGALGDLGSAALVAVAGLLALMTLAAPLGWRPLRSQAASVGLLVLLAVVAVLALRVLRRGRGPSAPRTAQLVTAAPALLVVGWAVAARFLPVGVRTEWYLGGDHVRHLVLTAEEQAAGVLGYDVESYPRAWHTVVALVWSAAGLRPEDSVTAVVDLGALLAWLLSAALALTTAALAASLGSRTGLGLRASAGAGFVAGCVTAWPFFLATYQALGLEGSLVAASVLAVVLRARLTDPTGARGFVVAVAGGVVLAHTWQLLLPVAALAALGPARGLLRAGRRGRLVLAVGLLVGAVAAWPALLAVVTRVGVQHASDADVVSPVPWAFLALGAGAAGVLVLRRRHRRTATVLALMAVPAVTGVLLALYVGVSPLAYYPSKLLWHTAVLGLAPLAVVVVGLALRVDRASFRGASLLRVVGGGGLATVLVFALLGPFAAFTGGWSTTDGPTVLRAVSAPGAGDAQVVWTDGPVVTDTVARILLAAVRPTSGGIARPQSSLTVEQECALLRAADAPAVLSDHPVAEVRARYACVPDVRVVAVPRSS
ncbi:MAG: hypothetical protein IE926_10390 [Micrococcales bacterium]|nr:hypothetical protein [Micrococcales bacterium]